jgi:hypothetical protein
VLFVVEKMTVSTRHHAHQFLLNFSAIHPQQAFKPRLFKFHPFVVSPSASLRRALSNHERMKFQAVTIFRSPFDKLRANGKSVDFFLQTASTNPHPPRLIHPNGRDACALLETLKPDLAKGVAAVAMKEATLDHHRLARILDREQLDLDPILARRGVANLPDFVGGADDGSLNSPGRPGRVLCSFHQNSAPLGSMTCRSTSSKVSQRT